jgi:glyoxylase-like metal-dependent hydrolase (beta-lactamase superfamily II)
MQSTALTANLIKLTRLGLVNAYLVREDDGFTLVDSMIPGSADRIIATAEQAGGAIRRLAFTHAHSDHVGSLDALKRRLGPDVQVLMPEIDAKILAGEERLERRPPGGWPKLETQPDVRLQPGDRVGSLEVISAPGHTPGHVAFLDTRDRALIAGDVFVTVGGMAVSSHFHLPFPFAAFATWEKAIDLQSARELAALDPTLLAIGHGGARPHPAAEMAAAIAKAERAAGG